VLAIGLVTSLVVSSIWGIWTGISFGAGAVLSFFNYRWLRIGVLSLTPASEQDTAIKPIRNTKRAFIKLCGRYVVLGFAGCVIMFVFRLPSVSFGAGLLTVLPAIIGSSLWQIITGE